MRPDMKQVIIERPRSGGNTYQKPPRPKFDVNNPQKYGDERKREGLYDYMGWNRKRQTDVLGPLIGFLRKNVGRPWDSIWSEVCEHNHDYMGDHVKLHIKQFVELHVLCGEDGQLYSESGYLLTNRRNIFYVHPVTRLLVEVKKKPFVRYKHRSRIFRLNGRDYFKFDDIWYRVTTRQFKPVSGREINSVDDVFGNADGYDYAHQIGYRLLEAYGLVKGRVVYCVYKQQANSRERKKLNQLLENRNR